MLQTLVLWVQLSHTVLLQREVRGKAASPGCRVGRGEGWREGVRGCGEGSAVGVPAALCCFDALGADHCASPAPLTASWEHERTHIRDPFATRFSEPRSWEPRASLCVRFPMRADHYYAA